MCCVRARHTQERWVLENVCGQQGDKKNHGASFPIPWLDDLLDIMVGATIFSKIDLKNDYHLICIWPGDKWKTVFKMKD